MESHQQEVQGTLPYPPSINKYWTSRLTNQVNPATGKRIKIVSRTKQVVKYMHDAYYLLKSQNLNSIDSKHLRVEFYIYPPDKKMRDIDNLVKSLQDVLQYAGIYKNDYFIDELLVKRCRVVKHGLVKFIIRAL